MDYRSLEEVLKLPGDIPHRLIRSDERRLTTAGHIAVLRLDGWS